MRRALVLTDEAAGHPFRRSLPAHVLSGVPPMRRGHARWSRRQSEGVALRRAPVAPPGRRGWRLSAQDWRDFLLAYGACFVAVSAFIW